MTSKELSNEQLTELIKNKWVQITPSETIEILDSEVALIRGANVKYASGANIIFKEFVRENQHVLDALSDIVCEHLNISTDDIIYSNNIGDEYEFIIRFAPDCLRNFREKVRERKF